MEDSYAGYHFFKMLFHVSHIPCISAKGKSNIARLILCQNPGAHILVIADGVAFGLEMEPVLRASIERNVEMYLPESFEWIILSSGLVKAANLNAILNQPSDFIESKDYFSWERFFTELLTEETKDSYLAYSKRKLNPVYLQQYERDAILTVTPIQLGE